MANLAEFNPSLETTRQWIGELMVTMGADESRACRALRVTLHELRDHLTVQETADLASQLPSLIRGVFYEGWRPGATPDKNRSKRAFLDNVGKYFQEESREEIEDIVRDVFLFLNRRVSPGEIKDVVNSLPKQLRELWPSYSDQKCYA